MPFKTRAETLLKVEPLQIFKVHGMIMKFFLSKDGERIIAEWKNKDGGVLYKWLSKGCIESVLNCQQQITRTTDVFTGNSSNITEITEWVF